MGTERARSCDVNLQEIRRRIFGDRIGPGWPLEAHSPEQQAHQRDTHARPQQPEWLDTDLPGRPIGEAGEGPHEPFPGKRDPSRPE